MFSVFTKKFPTFIRIQQVVRHAKFVRKSKEELREELENSRFKIVKDSLVAAMKQKNYLSVPEWKSLTVELNKNYLLTARNDCINQLVFSALLALPPPIDLLTNARNFIEASNLSYDLNTKRRFIQIYAKKHAENKLTDEEEKELIELLVTFIYLKNSMKIHMKQKIHTGSSFFFHLDATNLYQMILINFQRCIRSSHKGYAPQKTGKKP